MTYLILETISSFILFVIAKIGYFGVFLLMLLQSFNVPIPSEITMPFAGFLASQKVFNFWLAVIAGACGNLAGALMSYKLAGVLFRNGLRERWAVLKFFINESHLELAQKWFARYGSFSIFFGRLLPVVSTFISFPAGLAKMNLFKFFSLTFLGSLIWSFVLVKLGFVLGENWRVLQIYFRKFDYVIIIIIGIIMIWWVVAKLRGISRKNTQKL